MPVNKVVYGDTTLIDITDTTAVASDVALGKYFYALDGTKTAGTASGDGGSVTITDEANATGITCVITTSGEPTPTPSDIPLNTQLIDYTALVVGYIINSSDGSESSNEWSCCSDFTAIDPTMTFTYVAYRWFDMAFYDSSKTFISGTSQQIYADSYVNDYAHGTLTPARIPSNAAYIRLSTNPNVGITSTQLSLIRTA